MDVKGSAVVTTVNFVRKSYGSEAFEKWLGTLSDESRKIMTGMILPAVWYPMEPAFVEPTVKVCEMFYGGNNKGAWDIGRFSADYALRGIYSFFVKLGTPFFTLNRASRIFATYYQSAVAEGIRVEDNCFEMRITNLPERSGMVEQRIAGWCERGLQIIGVKPKVTILKSSAAGDEEILIHMEWT